MLENLQIVLLNNSVIKITKCCKICPIRANSEKLVTTRHVLADLAEHWTPARLYAYWHLQQIWYHRWPLFYCCICRMIITFTCFEIKSLNLVLLSCFIVLPWTEVQLTEYSEIPTWHWTPFIMYHYFISEFARCMFHLINIRIFLFHCLVLNFIGITITNTSHGKSLQKICFCINKCFSNIFA